MSTRTSGCASCRRRLARFLLVLVVAFSVLVATTMHATRADAATTAQPVVDTDAPDPSVLVVGHDYYMFTTATNGRYVPVWHSTDRVHWTLVGDAMPTPPRWSREDTTYSWAPTVVRIRGRYVMYVTERRRDPDQLCVAVATSPTPSGPYVSQGDEPLVCTHSHRGVYDASTFEDAAGNTWLTWRDDAQDAIVTQELSGDGTSLVGSSHVLLRADLRWEAGHVEGPSVVRVSATTMLLFYSAGGWRNSGYSTGVALCQAPAGPCTKASNPYLSTGSAGTGPGGASVFSDGSGVYLVYAAWRGVPNASGSYRAAYVVRLWSTRKTTATVMSMTRQSTHSVASTTSVAARDTTTRERDGAARPTRKSHASTPHDVAAGLTSATAIGALVALALYEARRRRRRVRAVAQSLHSNTRALSELGVLYQHNDKCAAESRDVRRFQRRIEE